MTKTINDPVFGDLEYNEDGYWTNKIFLGIWGGDNYDGKQDGICVGPYEYLTL